MKTTELNQTGMQISGMGMGAMHLSLSGRPSSADAISVIHEAFDQNVTFFDTADAYCVDEVDKHHNEKLVQEAIDSYEGDTSSVVVATKGGLVRPGGRWERNGMPSHLRKTIRESKEILGTIQLWQHHAPDSDVPVTESLRAAKEAQDEGIIRWIGVSNYSLDQLEQANEFIDIVSVQNQCSLWHRRPLQNGVLSYCIAHDITFLPYRPLGGSKHAKQVKDDPALRSLAKKKHTSAQQIALAWLLVQAPVVVPIPGFTRKATLLDSLGALDLNLSNDELEHITRNVAA